MNSQERLREFIRAHQPGACKVFSKGDGEQAEAIERYLAVKRTEAVMAVVTALSLDAGKRSKI